MPAKLYSAPEVAALLAVEVDTLYRYARRGKLRGVKIGKLWRFTETDVEEFIQGRRYVAPQERDRPLLLPDLLRRAAHRLGDSGGVVSGGRWRSYQEMDVLSDRLAQVLISAGVRPGDRVVTVLPNCTEFLLACFGIWKTRAVLVPEYTGVRPSSLRRILLETQPAALIVDRGIAEQLEEIHDALVGVRSILIKDRTFALSGLAAARVASLDAALDAESERRVALPGGGSPDDIVSITYTSGSTGTPKGVLHTHATWLAGAVFTRDFLALTAADTIIVFVPLHHGLAFRHLLAHVLAHARILITSDIYQALKALREERPTGLLLVPAACHIAIDHFATALRDADPQLRYVEIGSAAIAPRRLQQLRELLPTTPIQVAYGLTEARVAYLKRGPDGQVNRIGTVTPGLSVSVVDAAGRSAGPGQVGEIVLRGRGVSTGYWDGTVTSPRANGFRTGDLGRIDDQGDIELLGRLDDVVKVGGRKVNPAEVERTLERHPAVAEAAVVSMPDPSGILETMLHAFVVPKHAVAIREPELLAHCRRYLEAYKVPAQVYVRTSLPKSAVGKVLRHMLAKESLADVSPASEGGSS